MKKKIFILSLIFILFFGNTLTHSIEIQTLNPWCCCEQNCKCQHEKSSETIFRNIKCGDNSKNGNVIQNKNIISNSNKTFEKLTILINQINIFSLTPNINSRAIDPPPPKVLI